MPTEIRFAETLGQLLDDKFRRKRGDLAKLAHVSPSALSQYVRGKATPSLEVLAHLADALDVSVDYLVFGREDRTTTPDAGYVSSQLQSGILKAQSDSAALYDLVARVGARLGEQIRTAAGELVLDSATRVGTLTDDEVKALEACSIHTTIVTPSLDTEVLVLSVAGDQDAAAPSVFGEVVLVNIQQRRTYEYFVPTGRDLARQAELLRRQVIRRSGLPAASVDPYLRIRQLARACTPGYVIYTIIISELQQNAESIYDRVLPFLDKASTPAGCAHIATIEPASLSLGKYSLFDRKNLPHLLADVDELRRLASRDTKPQ